MLIERHASWLALNTVIGCPNNCIYCFLGEHKQTMPKQVCSAEDSVEKLIHSELFDTDIPICIMPNTDVFSMPFTKKIFFEILEIFERKNIKNLLTVITKRKISVEDSKRIFSYIKKGLKICVYVSYSGLPENFEKGIRHNGIEDALISMKNLHDNKVPCVHYWRPLLPQNSSKEQLNTVMQKVKDYCIGSCMTGLKLYPYMRCDTYWPEAQKAFESGVNPECFVPKNTFDNIISLAKENNYPVFIDNICLMAGLLKQPCKYGIYRTKRCLSYNMCSETQRKICGEFYNYTKPKKLENQEKLCLADILKKAKTEKVNIQDNNSNGQYWQSYFTNGEWLEL